MLSMLQEPEQKRRTDGVKKAQPSKVCLPFQTVPTGAVEHIGKLGHKWYNAARIICSARVGEGVKNGKSLLRY